MSTRTSPIIALNRLCKHSYKKRVVVAALACFGVNFMVYAHKPQQPIQPLQAKQSAQKSIIKPTAIQYWMDVATLTVSGITNTASTQEAVSSDSTGQLTGNINGKYGGTQGLQPGKWLDVTLVVPTDSAKEAEALSVLQTIPKGQCMGQSLQLSRMSVPSTPSQKLLTSKRVLRDPDAQNKLIEISNPQGQTDTLNHNASKKLLLYWGCGDRVRTGQPRQLDMIAANNSVQATGLKGRAVADTSFSDLQTDNDLAIWPNSSSRAIVPKEASLVGKHAFSGDNIPPNMQFDLKAKQDFMPALAINVNGIKGSATTLNWSRIPTAQAYFLMATAKTNREMIIWTSSELPEPGWGLMDYASNENLAQWKRNKVVLSANQTSCSIPAEIFNQSNGAMLSGIAYGEEANIKSRNASWNARIRVKSTTMQPFDEFNAAQLVSSPNAPTTLIRTFSLDTQPGTPGLEDTLNRLLTETPVKKPPKCHPCVKSGML